MGTCKSEFEERSLKKKFERNQEENKKMNKHLTQKSHATEEIWRDCLNAVRLQSHKSDKKEQNKKDKWKSERSQVRPEKKAGVTEGRGVFSIYLKRMRKNG